MAPRVHPPARGVLDFALDLLDCALRLVLLVARPLGLLALAAVRDVLDLALDSVLVHVPALGFRC